MLSQTKFKIKWRRFVTSVSSSFSKDTSHTCLQIYHKYKNLSRSVQKHWPHDDKKKGKNNNKGHCKAFFITQNPKKSNLKKKFVYRNYKTFKKICFKYRLRERLEYVNNCESLENIFHDVLNKKCLLSWHLSVQS